MTRLITAGIERVGQYGLFMVQSSRSMSEAWSMRGNILEQMVRVGVQSLPVVMLASAFAGVVVTVQMAYQLQSTFLSDDTIGTVVVPTLMLEMCALIPGLVMASRVGASIAAELGTMRVTEQIDALEAMGLNAHSYLVIPRVLGGTLMFPALYVASVLTAVSFAAWSGEYLGYLTVETFITGARAYFLPFDAFYGMTKSMAFGFLITSIACWKGFHTKGGATGVGRSTTEAVVTSCLNILIADYVLAELLL